MTFFVTLAGALAGGFVGRQLGHPVLGFIGGGTIARNASGLSRKTTTPAEVGESLARVAVASVGSLVMPATPLFGFVVGGLCADVALAGKGTGIVFTYGPEEKPREFVGGLHMLGVRKDEKKIRDLLRKRSIPEDLRAHLARFSGSWKADLQSNGVDGLRFDCEDGWSGEFSDVDDLTPGEWRKVVGHTVSVCVYSYTDDGDGELEDQTDVLIRSAPEATPRRHRVT